MKFKFIMLVLSIILFTGCSNQFRVSDDLTSAENSVTEAYDLQYDEESEIQTPEPQATENTSYTYIGNKNSKRFHYPHCRSVEQMKEKNKEYMDCTRDEMLELGYKACNVCDP